MKPDNDSSPAPFGVLAPNAAQAAILSLVRSTGLKRGAFRPWMSAIINLLRAGPLDVQYQGLVSLPPSLAPTFLQLDLPGLLHHDGGAPIAVLLQVVLVFVLVEVFDATGTLYGVVGRAGLLKLPGAQKRFGRALLAHRHRGGFDAGHQQHHRLR